MQQDRISVIVPVYKVEKYLPKCIESILNQTYRNLEILLVDDGSPDRCGGICDEYMEKDSRIKVIHKENGGLSDARNAGIREATGAFFGFVDSDDHIAPDMYEYLWTLMKENDADIGVCDACVIPEDGEPTYTAGENIQVYHGRESLHAMVCRNAFTVNTWNKLYKRQVFEGITFPVGMLYEDLATTYRLLEQAECVAVSDAQKYAYVQRNGSIMNQTATKMKVDKIHIVEQMWEHYSAGYDPKDDQLQAGILRYITNDIFRMIGSGTVSKNTQYRVVLKDFVRKNKKAIYKNPWLGRRNKAVLRGFLCCPKLLAGIYKVKSGGHR